MSELKFKDIKESEPMLKKLRIEKSKDMTDKDVEDFCAWICGKAERLGFNVSYVDENKGMG